VTLVPLLLGSLALAGDRRVAAPRGLGQVALVLVAATGAAAALALDSERVAGWLFGAPWWTPGSRGGAGWSSPRSLPCSSGAAPWSG
jgi:hypothetical protein